MLNLKWKSKDNSKLNSKIDIKVKNQKSIFNVKLKNKI